METITGVFRSRESADQAVGRLHSAGIRQVNLLVPGASDRQLHAVATSDAEQPGMGKAVGGVVGAAIGIAGGLELGAVAASMLIPGVGPVVAIGLAGAALLGALGAAGGAAAGAALESTDGIPADEIFVYKDALRRGRSVLFLEADGGDQAAKARALMAEAGAESIDAAREEWWIGLSSAEQEHYHTLGRDFERDGPAYRKGFEAALLANGHHTAEEAAGQFYPSGTDREAFRSGFERGQIHHSKQ